MRASLSVLPEFLRVQLWVVPSVAALIAALAAIILIFIDRQLDAMGLPVVISTESARAVLTSISGAMISFTALVFSVTMLVLQMASTQLSPRVTRSFLRDRFNQAVLGLFMATFVFSLLLLASINPDTVPQLGVLTAIGLVLAAVLAFVAYLDHMAHAIRPSSVLASITDETRSVIEAHYPPLADDAQDRIAAEDRHPDEADGAPSLSGDDSIIAWAGGSGYIQAIDEGTLLDFAEGEGHDVELVVGTGHFLCAGMMLLRVPDGTARALPAEAVGLDDAIHLGDERTMSQDPEFGFRQLVDVALRALSPSLHDPTTANQAIDRLGELLRHLQSRTIESPNVVRGDDGPQVRIPAPDWEAFLDLAVREISIASRSMPSVVEHLRSVLEVLRDKVRPEHAPSVSRALVMLDPADSDDGGPT